jgi:hypothetical protein
MKTKAFRSRITSVNLPLIKKHKAGIRADENGLSWHVCHFLVADGRGWLELRAD